MTDLLDTYILRFSDLSEPDQPVEYEMTVRQIIDVHAGFQLPDDFVPSRMTLFFDDRFHHFHDRAMIIKLSQNLLFLFSVPEINELQFNGYFDGWIITLATFLIKYGPAFKKLTIVANRGPIPDDHLVEFGSELANSQISVLVLDSRFRMPESIITIVDRMPHLLMIDFSFPDLFAGRHGRELYLLVRNRPRIDTVCLKEYGTISMRGFQTFFPALENTQTQKLILSRFDIDYPTWEMMVPILRTMPKLFALSLNVRSLTIPPISLLDALRRPASRSFRPIEILFLNFDADKDHLRPFLQALCVFLSKDDCALHSFSLADHTLTFREQFSHDEEFNPFTLIDFLLEKNLQIRLLQMDREAHREEMEDTLGIMIEKSS